MIELYHAPTSTCSQKVRMCLFEKNIEWISRPLNLASDEHLTPEYLAINPNGVVPDSRARRQTDCQFKRDLRISG